MPRAPLLLAACLAACAPPAGAGDGEPPPPASPALKVVARIPLPAVEGRIDHMAVDGDRKRLFVAALGNDTVEVVDLARGERVRTLRGVKGPTGVAWPPGPKRLAVASGGDGTLALFEGDEALERAATVDLGGDADNVRADPDGRTAWVGSGEGWITAVDGAKGERGARVELPGHPEAFALEPGGPRIFVNVPGRRAVAVVDREKRAVARTLRPGEASSNFPLVLDAAHRRLLIGCRRPASIVVLDTETGAAVASLDGPGDADDLFLDEARGRLYASGGSGEVAILERSEGDRWRALPPVRTAPGARTSLWVPEDRRLYVAAPRRGGTAAEILVLEAGK